jgi:hypothetical protein
VTQFAPVIATQKPTTVEAWKWDGTPEQARTISNWIATHGHEAKLHPYDNVIVLGDGYEAVKPDHWVIRDRFGDFWPLPDDVYQAVYNSPIS